MQKNNLSENKKVIISGGGTGGHLFPALAIAQSLKNKYSADILFVGALGKIEMEKVPEQGFPIEGLDIRGIKRSLSVDNLLFPVKLIKSIYKSLKIIKDFNPTVAVGVGGYASGPLLYAAGMKGIPTLLQEQNSFPGITNRLLAKRASKICVAYEGMDSFFPKEKILLLGNPVRKNILASKGKKTEAMEYFGFSEERQTIFITGGSLGALTLNESVFAGLKILKNNNVQVIWQCGKYYYKALKEKFNSYDYPGIKLMEFVDNIDLAYAASDLIISRAGAGAISELCLLGKPVILVPSPNVAEDHQTKNALALVDRNAAILIKDMSAKETLINKAISLLHDAQMLHNLQTNISELAFKNAAENIADEIIKLAEIKK